MKIKLQFCFLFLSLIVSGQTIFSGDFSGYTSNTPLSGQGIWTNNSSNPGGLGTCAGIGCVNTQVKDFSMSYLNYGSTSKAINILPNGDAVGLAFPAVNSGSVYFSFLLNFSDAVLDPNNASSNDFFRVMGGGNYNTLFRLNAFKVGTNFVLALQKESGAKVFTNSLNFNTTYLVVLKYTFNPGATDDVVSLYLNPTMSVTEPSTYTIATSSGSNSSEFTSIDRMNFRTNWTTIPSGYIGLVNVTSSWNNLLSSSIFSNPEESYNLITSTANSGIITLKLQNELFKNPNYSLFSIDGKLLAKGNIVSQQQENIEVSIPALSKGTYIFTLEEDMKKETKKFIVH